MKKDKKKSLTRTKKTSISLFDVLGAEAASSLVPGGGIIYKLSKTLFTHTKNWWEDRRNNRIEEFHEKLLLGIPKNEVNSFLRKDFSIDDYYSLLTHVVQDEENEKTDIYVKIFQSLILDLIPMEYKRHIIKSIKDLKFSDFELMRLLYINEKYEFKAPGNKINQIKSLTNVQNPIQICSIQTLIRLGYLFDKDGAKPPWPTDLLKIIIELLYDEDVLTPEAIGKEQKPSASERIKIFIACDDIGSFGPLLSNIGGYLFQNDIKNIIANPIRKSLPLMLAPIIAVCVSSNSNPMENINKFLDVNKKCIIQVLLPGATRENLPLEGKEVFDFSSDKIELERLVKFINGKLK